MRDDKIAQNAVMLEIDQIAKKLGLDKDTLIAYGRYKAKISSSQGDKQGKLILVSAINPTPAGEGKTTVTIGLADALNASMTDKQAVVAMREPSLGPVFGIKGGAAGGGYAQVVPMEDINLHFTGDMHAIGAANNLLAAMIDNHIYQGNALDIDPERVLWRRAVDMNDRQLRHITSGQTQKTGKNTDGVERADGFDITVASEVMACFCLAHDLDDLKIRLGEMLVAYDRQGRAIFAKDLQAHGAMTALLKEAFLPNLVQTLAHTPALVHGGPFANIAHGCNSLVATKLGLSLADFVVTEAGFGADLGAEKFCDIKCRQGITPSVCVLVATVRALKYNAGVAKDALTLENTKALEQGLPNLLKHIDTMKHVFGLPVVVAINRFVSDTQAELDMITHACQACGARVALCEVWEKGATGGTALAQEVLAALQTPSDFRFCYDLHLPIKDKIEKVATQIYGACGVVFEEKANRALADLYTLGIDLDALPICMAKTQYSLSDDPKKLGVPTDFKITVSDIHLSNGVGFVVVMCGKMMKMPGLPEVPAACNIDVIDGKIVGLF